MRPLMARAPADLSIALENSRLDIQDGGYLADPILGYLEAFS